MPMGSFFEEQFEFAKIFNLLKLNDSEVGLYTAIVIMNPCKCLFDFRRKQAPSALGMRR